MVAADGVQERQEEDLLKPSMGRLLHFKKTAGFCAWTAVEMDGHIMPGDLMQTECGGEDKARCERSCWARGGRGSRAVRSGRELLWRGSQASHQHQCLLSSDRNTQNSQRTQRIVRDPCWDTCLRRTRCKILLSVPSILRTTALKGLSHSWGPPHYTVL